MLTDYEEGPRSRRPHALKRSVVAHSGHVSGSIARRHGLLVARALAIVTTLSIGVATAPSAIADDASPLSDALAQARAASSCAPLSANPVVEKVTEKINQSNTEFLEFTATDVPIVDPLPGLHVLGYSGNKAEAVQGAGKNETDAVKGMLLAGLRAIPNCSYTDFGVSMVRNERTGWYLAVVVLAGA